MAAELIELPKREEGDRYRNFFIVPAKWRDVIVLAADTAEDYTPPTGARYISFDYETGKADVWAQFYDSVTAVIPTADVTTGVAAIRNPLNIELLSFGVTEISLISSEAQVISVQVWK